MKKYNVKGKIISTGEKIELVINWNNEATKDYSNKFSCVYNNKKYESTGYEVYFTFEELLDQLLDDDIGLDIKGAMINATQSEMQSQCSKIYLTEIGKKPDSYVDIFDFYDNNEYPDSNDRKEYNKKWIESIDSDFINANDDKKSYKKVVLIRNIISYIIACLVILLFYFLIYRR